MNKANRCSVFDCDKPRVVMTDTCLEHASTGRPPDKATSQQPADGICRHRSTCLPFPDKVERAIAESHCEIPIGHGAQVETCVLCYHVRVAVHNALVDAERCGAYSLFIAVRKRSQSICRHCEPKISSYMVAEEFDRLFPDPTPDTKVKHEP